MAIVREEALKLIEQLAIKYHKGPEGEGEYGCNGLTCPGVQRLIAFGRSCAEVLLDGSDLPSPEAEKMRYALQWLVSAVRDHNAADCDNHGPCGYDFKVPLRNADAALRPSACVLPQIREET